MNKPAIAFTFAGVATSLWLVTLIVSPTALGQFSEEGRQLLSLTWGRISLIDLYAGFLLAIALVWILESKLWVKLAVSILLPIIGNPVLAVWLLWRFKHIAAMQKQ